MNADKKEDMSLIRICLPILERTQPDTEVSLQGARHWSVYNHTSHSVSPGLSALPSLLCNMAVL